MWPKSTDSFDLFDILFANHKAVLHLGMKEFFTGVSAGLVDGLGQAQQAMRMTVTELMQGTL